MKKRINFILTVVASVMLANCTSDEYIGGDSGIQGTESAITFGSSFKAVTRATSNEGTAAQMLDGHFKVFGVKNVSSAWTGVFQNYIVWNNTTGTSSNPDGDWEYVGDAGTHGTVTTTTNQYIKYWDQSATDYHFVAGSPADNFTFNTNDGNIVSATVTGIAGHINPNTTGTPLATNPVYIAEPVNVPKAKFKEEVTFNFTRQQSFVRVGVYETIPGYSISEIKFYRYNESSDAWTDTKSSNITLASQTAKYFTGATNAKAAITYEWPTEGAPKYTYVYEEGLSQQKNWYGGLLNGGVKATSSTETTVANLYGTDSDMGDNGYFTVIPSASALTAAPILVKCDYTLTSLDGNGETITMTGKIAAIPAAFSFWKPNTSYTYLFKITDNDLSPITFDAVVVDATNAIEGTITTVSTPSITTYQEGSVTAEGIKYKYNATTPSDTKPIYFTVQNDESGALYTLTDGGSAVGAVQVYKLNGAKTEADLQVSAPTGTDMFTLGTVAATVGKFSFEANKYGYFTPTAAGYYAIQYLTKAASDSDPAAYTYKIVYVE